MAADGAPDENAVRARLLAERDELVRVRESAAGDLKPVALDQQSVGRLSRIDAMQRQEMSLAQERRRQVRLQVIAAALQRLADGEWGYCLSCGEDIQPKRLGLDPAVTLCTRCAGAKAD